MYRMTLRNHSRALSVLLALWVYTYALFYFVPLIIPSTTMLMYLWLIVIDILVIFHTKSLSKRAVGFIFVYTLIALVNVVVVSYKYYAAIDAFSGLAVFLPALLIISSSVFDLKDFLNIWQKYAVFTTLISPVAIILMQNGIIDYGVFTYLNLPNCIIFSYHIMAIPKGDSGRFKLLVMDLLNFIIILAFGGRMAAFAGAFSIFIGYMISSSVKLYKKCILILFVGIFGVIAINNLSVLLHYFEAILNKYNLSSRSLSLLLEQLESGNAGMYLTRRNVIYEEIVDYIVDRGGLPGGFGVSLNISDGQFYHPHNLFLQLAVMLGVIGEGIFIILILYRLLLGKRTKLHYEYQFTLLLLIEYLIISFTGGSILNNYVAILGIGMVFFYRSKDQSIRKSYGD